MNVHKNARLAAINSGCAAPVRSASDAGHTPWGSRSANDSVRGRNDAVDAGDRHLLADFKAQRTDDGYEQNDSHIMLGHGSAPFWMTTVLRYTFMTSSMTARTIATRDGAYAVAEGRDDRARDLIG
jgi:hypothetical protein